MPERREYFAAWIRARVGQEVIAWAERPCVLGAACLAANTAHNAVATGDAPQNWRQAVRNTLCSRSAGADSAAKSCSSHSRVRSPRPWVGVWAALLSRASQTVDGGAHLRSPHWCQHWHSHTEKSILPAAAAVRRTRIPVLEDTGTYARARCGRIIRAWDQLRCTHAALGPEP